MSLALALALAMSPAVQTGSARPLPPDIDDGFNSMFLAMFREPPLWVDGAATGYKSRIRVSLMANFDLQVSLRIDEREDGSLAGTAVSVRRGTRGGGYSVRSRKVTHFAVSRQQMDELDAEFAKLDMWKFERGSWADPDDICVDGLEMVFERADAAGYRHAHANAACDAPGRLQRATRLWLQIAGVGFPWELQD